MNPIEFTLYIIILLTSAAGLCWFLLKKANIEETSVKWLLTVATAAVAIIALCSLWGLQNIPATANDLIVNTTDNIEQFINSESPDATNQPVNPDGLKELIDNHRNLEAYLEENETAGWLVDLVVSRSLRNSVSSLAEHTENIVTVFETQQIPFTIHNLLTYITENTQKAIADTVKNLQRTLLLLTAIAYLIILFFYFSNKKGWFTTKTGGVTFGEEFES